MCTMSVSLVKPQEENFWSRYIFFLSSLSLFPSLSNRLLATTYTSPLAKWTDCWIENQKKKKICSISYCKDPFFNSCIHNPPRKHSTPCPTKPSLSTPTPFIHSFLHPFIIPSRDSKKQNPHNHSKPPYHARNKLMEKQKN